MPYIGKNLVGVLKDARASDTMTGDGSDTTLTLTDTPGSTNNVLVFLDGIRQTPVTDYWVTGRVLTFTTAPEVGVLVVALTGSASSIDPKIGSVTSSKIVDGMVMNAKIASLSASKLTGALPAISGAALTNVVTSSGIDTVSADPTISTNPSGGVGTIQLNQVSGEMYVCTDATAGANVWTNVGGGSGHVAGPFGGTGGGTISGFSSGGYYAPNYKNVIDKFSLTSSGNATDHGDLSTAKLMAGGSLSKTQGFVAGGDTNAAGLHTTSIDKFTFASSGNAVSHGDLSSNHGYTSGQSSSTHGYTSGGTTAASNPIKIIDKYAFSANTTATDNGDLILAMTYPTGSSSYTDGYTNGGGHTSLPGYYANQIYKFSFATAGNATDHGDLTLARGSASGHSSITHGYTAGGEPANNTIDKYAFASDATATDHGDMSAGRSGNQRIGASGTSSTTHGFSSGGTLSNIIDKFAFSSNTTATDHGDLSDGRKQPCGSQY